MGLSDDTEENSEARFEDLCLDLNLDKKAKEEAWQAFEAMRTNYTLEVGFTMIKAAIIICGFSMFVVFHSVTDVNMKPHYSPIDCDIGDLFPSRE